MPSEVDWGAHETHPNGHSITKVDWGGHASTLYPVMDACSLKLIWEPMIQVSSFTLCTLIMMQSQRIYSPRDCGEDYHKGQSHRVPERFF